VDVSGVITPGALGDTAIETAARLNQQYLLRITRIGRIIHVRAEGAVGRLGYRTGSLQYGTSVRLSARGAGFISRIAAGRIRRRNRELAAGIFRGVVVDGILPRIAEAQSVLAEEMPGLRGIELQAARVGVIGLEEAEALSIELAVTAQQGVVDDLRHV